MEKRILIYAPVGKDALLASQVLERAGLACHVCSQIPEIMRELNNGAGALFLVEEALADGAFQPLAKYVADQPAWSDIPILILTNHGADSPGLQSIVEALGNFTLLERPVRATALVSAVRSALRGRIRQYQMRETDRLKDEFLASLGHELRNPLAPIRTSVQVLDHMFPDTPRVGEVTRIIERQVGHLTRLVDDLLDVARVTSGKVSLQRREVPLSAVVAHAVEICSTLIKKGGHELVVEQPAHEVMLNADSARLVQSLSNVLANAAKFSPDPSTIVFSVGVDHENVSFTIRDSGIGLERDALSRIFDMFAQDNAARGQVLGGLGIGLGLAKRFTEMHGGTIRVFSEGIGHGCEFVLTLPVVIAPQTSAATNDAASASRQKPSDNMRVLVVDDNQDGADMLQLMLEMDGYAVCKAYSGQQALETARETRPHVVLMDIGLPDMDGYEAARRIRQMPGCESTVLIAVTGWGHEDARRRATDAGMDHHLVKPVDLDVLRDCLSRIAGVPRAA